MNVSLNGLQRNVVESFSEVIGLIKRSKRSNHADYIIDAYELQYAINALRTDVVMLACIIDPDTDKSFLNGDDGPTVPYLEFDEND